MEEKLLDAQVMFLFETKLNCSHTLTYDFVTFLCSDDCLRLLVLAMSCKTSSWAYNLSIRLSANICCVIPHTTYTSE